MRNRSKHIIKFIFKLLILGATIIIFIIDKEQLNFKNFTPFSFLGVVWLAIIIDFIMQLFPSKLFIQLKGMKKQFAKFYQEREDYDESEYLHHQEKTTKQAFIIMILWLVLNGIFAVIFYMKVIDESFLVVLTTLYYLGDLICVLFYCPFQDVFLKTKCCSDCRIYGWGNFFMVTPLCFTFSFFSTTLFIFGFILFLIWEVRYHLYPKRFSPITNKYIDCINCPDQTCVKKISIFKNRKEKEK